MHDGMEELKFWRSRFNWICAAQWLSVIKHGAAPTRDASFSVIEVLHTRSARRDGADAWMDPNALIRIGYAGQGQIRRKAYQKGKFPASSGTQRTAGVRLTTSACISASYIDRAREVVGQEQGQENGSVLQR